MLLMLVLVWKKNNIRGYQVEPCLDKQLNQVL